MLLRPHYIDRIPYPTKTGSCRFETQRHCAKPADSERRHRSNRWCFKGGLEDLLLPSDGPFPSNFDMIGMRPRITA